MSRWGYSWRWKEGTCNHANWVQIGLVDDSFITPPRGFLTAQLPANFATVVSHRALSLSMATITRSNVAWHFFNLVYLFEGPSSLFSLRLYFYYTRRSCGINLSIPFFLFFFSLFLTSTINSSSRRRTKEGISFSGRSHRSSFALKKKKRKIATNPSNPCSTPSGSGRQDPWSRVWKSKAIRLFLLTWNFFAKCRETAIFPEYQWEGGIMLRRRKVRIE